MRLIDADTFMEECRNRIEVNAPHLPLYIRDFVIDEMPTVDAEPKWIPVSERLPEPLETVLVTFTWKGGRYVTTDRYRYMSTFNNPIYWLDTSQYMDTQKVVAWMPLPKPYEVKNERH